MAKREKGRMADFHEHAAVVEAVDGFQHRIKGDAALRTREGVVGRDLGKSRCQGASPNSSNLTP